MVLLAHLVKSKQPSLEVSGGPLYYIYVLLCVYLTCESKATVCCICKRKQKTFSKEIPPKAAPMLATPRKRLLNTDLRY